MLTATHQRIIFGVLTTLLLLLILSFNRGLEEEQHVEKSTFKLPDIIQNIERINSMNTGDDKNASSLKNIPVFLEGPSTLLVNPNTKTAVCETDDTIGQAVLCGLEEDANRLLDKETLCDSDSLISYQNFSDFTDGQNLDKNFSNWRILFPRRDPVERLVDEFIMTCIRENRKCFGCWMDIKCYLIELHEFIKSDAGYMAWVNNFHKRYIPQNWFCNFETMAHNFEFIEYKKYGWNRNPEIADSQRSDNWQSWGYFKDPVRSYAKLHKYFTDLVVSRPDLMDLVKKMYYWDFVMLKIPFPSSD